MIETVSNVMWIGRMTRLPVVRRLILLSVLCSLASLAVTVPASATTTFTNTAPITIPSSGNASPYPSEINGCGLAGPITDLSVTLHRFGHKFPSEVDILLVSPSGTGVVLMSDACANAGNIEEKTWVFSDSALTGTMAGNCEQSIYRPTNVFSGPDGWPPPAPAGPYSENLGAFNNEVAKGTWKLYVVDDTGNDGGNRSRKTQAWSSSHAV